MALLQPIINRCAATMQMLNSYLLSPQSTQTPSKRKQGPSGQQLRGTYKKRSTSLISIYSSKLHELSPRDVREETHAVNIQLRHQQRMAIKQNTLQALSIDQKTVPHVENTINTVNQYAEQLRMTLLNEYKQQKNNSLRSRRMRQTEEAIDRQLIDDVAPGTLNNKVSNKAMAYKTLNLLYRAIIDNSFQRRRKEEFQLQANRLPIVDRFHNRRRLVAEKTLELRNHSLEVRKPHVPSAYFAPALPAKPVGSFSLRRTVKDESCEIIPWVTDESTF